MKLPQILQLNPASEIVFVGPFDRVVTSYLELKNPSDLRVCFKVKTTAPKRYCVRPNSGIVEPSKDVKIAIMLQPMDADSQAERNKHKFMVQSTIVRNEENTNLDRIWLNAAPEDVMDSKLRCVFRSSEIEEGDTQSGANKDVNKEATAGEMGENDQVPDVVKQAISTSDQSKAVQYQAERIRDIGTSASKLSMSASLMYDDDAPDVTRNTSTKSTSTTLARPMNDDYKIVILSLVMLFLGVILGKYII